MMQITEIFVFIYLFNYLFSGGGKINDGVVELGETNPMTHNVGNRQVCRGRCTALRSARQIMPHQSRGCVYITRQAWSEL